MEENIAQIESMNSNLENIIDRSSEEVKEYYKMLNEYKQLKSSFTMVKERFSFQNIMNFLENRKNQLKEDLDGLKQSMTEEVNNKIMNEFLQK